MSAIDSELDGLLGTTVGEKYRLDELIGRGGMGAVFRATNTAIGKRVALKFLYREAARDQDAVTRFQREAEAASAVESAHIVEIFDSGVTADGLPFLVMELLRGEDLRARLQREGRLAARQVVYIGGQVARALRRAHDAGIVHRDLKPDNIFVCHRDDDPLFVKLVDFGISKVARKSPDLDTLTRRGVVLGTAYYMSPEQAQAKPDIDGRADLYSLGAILFEALTGQPPHDGNSYEAVLIAICTKDAPDVRDLVPDVPPALAELVARALSRDREARFQTATELYEALNATQPGLLITGEELTGSSPFVSSAQRSGPAVALSSPPDTSTGSVVSHPLRPATRRQTMRTIVTAAITALAAFAGTVLLTTRLTNPSGQATVPAESATRVSTAPTPPSERLRAATRPALLSAATSAAPSASTKERSARAEQSAPQATAPSIAPTTHPPRASARPRPRPSPRAASLAPRPDGVGSGLELATEP